MNLPWEDILKFQCHNQEGYEGTQRKRPLKITEVKGYVHMGVVSPSGILGPKPHRALNINLCLKLALEAV